jgi:hypothetical protein
VEEYLVRADLGDFGEAAFEPMFEVFGIHARLR